MSHEVYVAVLRALEKVFSNVNVREAVSASENTAGLEAVLQAGYRRVVEVYVRCGGACDIEVYGSIDGSEWRLVEKTSLGGAGEWHAGYMNGFPWVKVRVPTKGIDVVIEITANP